MRLAAAVCCLTAVTFAGYGIALASTGASAVVPATLGLAITLPPTLFTLLAVVRVSRWRADAGPVIVLAGTFLRMVWAVGVVAVLQGRAEAFGTTPTDVAQWTTGFYLLTLAVETALLWKLLSPKPNGRE